MTKQYYAERQGKPIEIRIDYDKMVDLFVNSFNILNDKSYFKEAIGDYCKNKGKIPGKCGDDIESFIFSKTHISNLWPIDKDEYYSKDDSELFTMIEFLYDYVSEPIEFYDCGNYFCTRNHCNSYDSNKGKEIYRAEINSILSLYKDGYILTEDGEVLHKAPSGLETLIEERLTTSENEKIDDRINSAISQFLKFDSTIADKKAALLSLGGVLEYLKTSGIKLEKKDDSALFEILNGFDLRHHQKLKQNCDYEKEEWYEWFFYTFLSSIRFLLKQSNKLK